MDNNLISNILQLERTNLIRGVLVIRMLRLS